MPTKVPNELSFARSITKPEISFAYEFLTGSAPDTDVELNSAAHISNTFNNSRLELFRRVTGTSAFNDKSRDLVPILIDQVFRRKVFGGVAVPKVNAFCVGAPRCGTTTLSVLLAQNREVYSSPIKETNFFSHLWNGAAQNGIPIESYELFYYGWNGEPVLTDFSPLNLRYKHAMDGIHSYNPKAKIIVCLRDPVERAISAFFYTKAFHKFDNILDYYGPVLSKFSLDVPKAENWFSPASLLRQSFYSSDLKYIRTLFPNVLLVNFSEFADISKLNKKVCEFLGVQPGDVDSMESGSQRINASTKDGGGGLSIARQTLENFFAKERLCLKNDFNLVFGPEVP